MVSAAGGRHRATLPDAPTVAAADPSPAAADGPSVGLSQTVSVLVEAIVAVSADLDLDRVLRRILESACVVAGAPHGMLAIFEDQRAILFGERPPGEPLNLVERGLLLEIAPQGRPFARLCLGERPGAPFNIRDELMLGQLVLASEQAIANAFEHRRAVAASGEDDLADPLPGFPPGYLPDYLAGYGDDVGLDPAGADIEGAVRVERERIARDLHDTVIQRLFATGLQLQALRRTVDETAGEAITAAVRDLDATMKDLRATVYALRRSRPVSMLAQVEALVEEYAAGLGFRPALHLSGPIDDQLEGDLGDHVLATLREALSNIVKHARASAAAVELHVSPTWTLLRVTDNGVGIPAGERGVLGSGLSNLRIRAERLGGALRLSRNGLDWIVPTLR